MLHFIHLKTGLLKTFCEPTARNLNQQINTLKISKTATMPLAYITRKAILATKDESKINPRARSAKLRAAIRTEVAA